MFVSVASKSLAVHQSTSIAPAVEASSIKRELRVLQVFSVLSVGGAETWLMALLRYFREAEDSLPMKVKCDILLTGGEPSVFDEEAKALGARLFYVPFTRRNPLGFMRQFRRLLAAGNYDVIHDHQDYIAGLHLLMGLGRLPRVRVAHVHNPLYQRTQYTNGLIRRVSKSVGRRLLRHLATNILGTSRQIVTEYGFDDAIFRDVARDAAHCGIEVSKYQGDHDTARAELRREFGWSDSARVILFVGRLESDEVRHLGRTMTHKNPAFALEVVRECMARDETLRLLMVGAGDTKRREFESQIRTWGLEQRITLTGVRADVPRLMLGSDLLLFPSLAEGLGMVVVEAQAAGLRVLASDTTPRECVVVPGLVKFLSLSLTLRAWADEASQIISLGHADSAACVELVKQSPFSIENSAVRLLNVYGNSQ